MRYGVRQLPGRLTALAYRKLIILLDMVGWDGYGWEEMNVRLPTRGVEKADTVAPPVANVTADKSMGREPYNSKAARRQSAVATRGREDGWDPPSRGRYGGQAARATIGGRGFATNMCFCETNPPILAMKFFGTSVLQNAYDVCTGRLQVGSFWKTNPPGGCFRGVFMEKWVRLRC